MNLQNRIEVLVKLGEYIRSNTEEWNLTVKNAALHNTWFTEEFINLAAQNITECFLSEELLSQWCKHYHLDDLIKPVNVGIVMAGNIPLVGFHDMMCVFISGHRQTIKLSSKDNILLKYLIDIMSRINPQTADFISISDHLKACDAYITTGGNQSADQFERYFGKYPNIIRRNRTSVAILDGKESTQELDKLSDDVHLYFGLGCRNVTKLYIPANYDFVPLIQAFNKYSYFRDISKYANNYDYQLSLLLLNNIKYMSSESTLLTEQSSLLSPIGMLYYEQYDNKKTLTEKLRHEESIQCMVGNGEGLIPFGKAQQPELFQYADGKDTLQFLLSL